MNYAGTYEPEYQRREPRKRPRHLQRALLGALAGGVVGGGAGAVGHAPLMDGLDQLAGGRLRADMFRLTPDWALGAGSYPMIGGRSNAALNKAIQRLYRMTSGESSMAGALGGAAIGGMGAVGLGAVKDLFSKGGSVRLNAREQLHFARLLTKEAMAAPWRDYSSGVPAAAALGLLGVPLTAAMIGGAGRTLLPSEEDRYRDRRGLGRFARGAVSGAGAGVGLMAGGLAGGIMGSAVNPGLGGAGHTLGGLGGGLVGYLLARDLVR